MTDGSVSRTTRRNERCAASRSAGSHGEDEDWLYDLSIDMFPEDGCLRVYGVGEDGAPAFTQFGIECLQEIIRDQRAAGKALPQPKSTEYGQPPLAAVLTGC
jgi:hypothetical protein